MTDSVYRKTPLPAKLDLNKRNTREQLQQVTDDKRGSLEGITPTTAAKDSTKDCNDVMQKDLRKWLVDHDITGPPPSAEAEQRAMWQWIRDFHKEYNDDWYTRNMPRLRDIFRPIFVAEMKSMRGERPGSAKEAGASDLLDFGGSPPAKAAPAPGPKSGSQDLLAMDEPAVASTAPVDLTADLLAPATSPSPAAAGPLEDVLGGLSGGSVPSSAPADNLLNLDMGGSHSTPPVAGGYTAAAQASLLAPQTAAAQMPQQPQAPQASQQDVLQQLQQQLSQLQGPALQQLTQQLQQQVVQQSMAQPQQMQQQPQLQQQQPLQLQQPLQQQQPPQQQPQSFQQMQLDALSFLPSASEPSSGISASLPAQDFKAKKADPFDFNLM
eukprot:TRINITY_DN15904_c0_g1_i1.p1 TRINITY_DN15904_c0_g1~~TRINITY_DN15904_c0_g1_i1.p1  ORF type:complete len:381 (+),score=125.28 TRINITY_DN15904_c0_g1_i1:114-1256(+)